MEAESGIYKKPLLLAHLRAIRKKIYTKVGELETFISTDSEPIPFDKRKSCNYRKIHDGETWGKAFTCSWFNFKGNVPESARLNHIVLITDIGGEGLYVDENNEPLYGITSKMCWVDKVQSTRGKTVIEFSACAKGGEDIDIWVDAGFNGKRIQPFGTAQFNKAYIASCRDDVKDYYYDYLMLSFALSACADKIKQDEIDNALKSSYSALKDYSIENVKEAGDILQRVLCKRVDCKKLVFTAIGHSHLDLGWLWPVRETRRKAARTFSIALKNIEKYPGYIYGASQPQQFQWVKEDYPSLYKRISDAVKKGRIELQGGMWAESDTNLTSGESLVRQIYYGKKFFMDEFGQDMKICWLPDVFGYNANLPQILKKTGLLYFMTIKLSWNEHNAFPYKTFNWTGIDGSSVLVHMAPEGDYNSGGTPLCVKRAADNFTEKDELHEALLVYGAGDGGGGPGEVHIELIKRQENLEGFPSVYFGRAVDFFERLNLVKDKLKSYKGELYLEKHQGTYTTQARNKYLNRKIEFLLHDVEMLAAYAYLKGYEYPHSMLERIWKEVLLYQFHDIIPGSSIKRVYDESRQRYADMMKELEDEKQSIFNFLSPDKSSTFINTSSFSKDDYIKHDDKWYHVKAEPFSSSPICPVDNAFELKYSYNSIENEFLKVVFSDKGHITSLYDKINDMESCGKYLNKLTLYTDKWMYFNAWDIDINYHKKRKIYLRLLKTETFIDGPNVIRKNYYRHGETELTQYVILTSGKQYVEFDTECEYHETFRMLRADFMPAIYSDTVKCDIQFGSFDRSTKDETSIEKAQFEICAHKWVDLSNGDYGVSLINDCKYGHRVKEGLLSLNLLRSPVYPDPTADRGKHRFRYAFYPHKGDIKKSDTIRQAYLFNMQPVICDNNISFGPLIVSEKRNIVIETIKKAEGEDAIVLRLYECYGQDTDTCLITSIDYSEAFECDMLEHPISRADLKQLSFTPFEVKTILLRLK